MKILVLDNYDSFTYNLVHLLKELGEGTKLKFTAMTRLLWKK
jgi:anthranilate synthase component 2